MLILVLDAALARCTAAITRGGNILSERRLDQTRGHALLAPMAADVRTESGIAAQALDAVAVTIGPGSFTGLRAALALAHGIALAAGCPVVGVTIGEAMAEGYAPPTAGRVLWTVIDSRRGRVFLDRGPAPDGTARIAAFGLDSLPVPGFPVALAGDAATEVAARLAAADADVALSDLRLPQAAHIARAAARQFACGHPLRPAQPLYIDPPEAKLPAGGLRPAPQPA
jgi:tRNA threonylcarbamoyl adenosine modification protein YeaZ